MKKLSQKIVKLLKKKRLKISFAESCTGGLLSSVITSISGSSKVFTLGLVTYSNESKINTLKIPKKIIMKHGAVSYETCLSMVKNLNKITEVSFDVDFELKNHFLNIIMTKSFQIGLDKIADAFQKRAEELFSRT